VTIPFRHFNLRDIKVQLVFLTKPFIIRPDSVKHHPRSVKAFVLASGNVCNAAVGILIAAIFSRLLTKDDYATYRQTILIYGMAAPLLSCGLAASLVYFLPRQPEDSRQNLMDVLLVLLGLAGAGALGFYFVGADIVATAFRNPELATTLRWYALYPVFALPVAALGPCLVSQGRVDLSAAFTIISQLIRGLCILLPLVFWSASPLLAVIGTLAAAIIVFFPGLFLMFRVTTGTVSLIPSGHGIWQKLCYGIPLGLGTAVAGLNMSSDKLIVALGASNADFAIFVNGAMEIPITGIITGSIAAVLTPDLTVYFHQRHTTEAIAVFRRAVLKSATMLIPLAGLMFVLAPEIMIGLYGDKFAASATFFRVYAIVMVFRVANWGCLYQAAGSPVSVLTRALLRLCSNAVLSVGLFLLFGPIGVAIGTVAALALFTIPYNLISISKLYRVPMRSILPFGGIARRSAIVLSAGVVTLWSSTSVEAPADSLFWILLFWKSAIYSLIIVCMLLASGALRLSDLSVLGLRMPQGAVR